MIDLPIDQNAIVVTASRAPQEAEETPASVSTIDETRIERSGEPLLPALLRLTPSAAVATSGPTGSLTEVRIRGAENNHTLLFIDGIRVNDPATGNQPRFELLNADIASRMEVVRGPQSALWGSEAIGGVIAVEGTAADNDRLTGLAEAGSFGFRRASASAGLRRAHGSIDVAYGWQRASGIDSFDGKGDRDGYRNQAGRIRASGMLAPAIELGASALALSGRSEFDGYSPATFARADTLDSSRNRLVAGRLWAAAGRADARWRGRVETSLLASSNRNFLDEEEINRTNGRRWTVAGQVEHRLTAGGIAHSLIAAADHEREEFRANDTVYGGFTAQDRSREHQALTVEWRAQAGRVTGDLVVRRDRFSRFEDATSLRASALAEIGGGFAVAASYGEGIAQPTFYDLYGFFPGNFVGNPDLKPESSRGVEASLRYSGRAIAGALTWHRQRLRDEIVDIFDAATFQSTTANRDSRSRRSGVEAELGWRLGEQLRLSAHYAYLRASEPGLVGGSQVREVRRPKHSGSIAIDGASKRLSYGASLAYTGGRRDVNFDLFPSQDVRLGSYWLAGARVAYRLTEQVEAFARSSNALDERYQDVFGYRTEGRSLHVGIRLAPRR